MQDRTTRADVTDDTMIVLRDANAMDALGNDTASESGNMIVDGAVGRNGADHSKSATRDFLELERSIEIACLPEIHDYSLDTHAFGHLADSLPPGEPWFSSPTAKPKERESESFRESSVLDFYDQDFGKEVRSTSEDAEAKLGFSTDNNTTSKPTLSDAQKKLAATSLPTTEESLNIHQTQTVNSETTNVTWLAGKTDKREWDSWDAETRNTFFKCMQSRLDGPKLFQYISKKVETKTPEQCRQYYYRILKRANALLKTLGTSIDIKSAATARLALLAWAKVYKKNTSKNGLPPKLDSRIVQVRFTNQLQKAFRASMVRRDTIEATNAARAAHRDCAAILTKMIPKATVVPSGTPAQGGKSQSTGTGKRGRQTPRAGENGTTSSPNKKKQRVERAKGPTPTAVKKKATGSIGKNRKETPRQAPAGPSSRKQKGTQLITRSTAHAAKGDSSTYGSTSKDNQNPLATPPKKKIFPCESQTPLAELPESSATKSVTPNSCGSAVSPTRLLVVPGSNGTSAPDSLRTPTHVKTGLNVPATPCSARTPRSNRVELRLRIVPIDKNSRNLILGIGARSKVELKVTGSKTIADVHDHMMNKWKAVASLNSIAYSLRFVPVGDRRHPGWCADDISVTCLHISNQFSSSKDRIEGVLNLEYKWVVEEDYLRLQRSIISPSTKHRSPTLTQAAATPPYSASERDKAGAGPTDSMTAVDSASPKQTGMTRQSNHTSDALIAMPTDLAREGTVDRKALTNDVDLDVLFDDVACEGLLSQMLPLAAPKVPSAPDTTPVRMPVEVGMDIAMGSTSRAPARRKLQIRRITPTLISSSVGHAFQTR